jgi:hypothetical protein
MLPIDPDDSDELDAPGPPGYDWNRHPSEGWAARQHWRSAPDEWDRKAMRTIHSFAGMVDCYNLTEDRDDDSASPTECDST